MSTTTVGIIEYDVRLNLPQLKKDTQEAEKIVNASYDKIEKAQKKTSGSSRTSGAPAGNATGEAVAKSIEATKKAAQESFNSMSAYSPQIQKQFLAVERANLRVEQATLRSSGAITRFGQDSNQAKSATNSLSGAVLNQSQQQQKLNGMLDGSIKATVGFRDSINNSIQSLAAFGASFLVLRTLGNILTSSVQKANQYESAMLGLQSVSVAFGADVLQVNQAAVALASDGLIPLSQSVQAFKNALSTGYSIEEATALLRGLKDQAAFNRQSQYDLGSAVVATTEGIKNGNSVLADATGTTQNLASMAKEAGINLQDLGNAETKAAYNTAILNGFLQNTNRSLGDAERYADTAAGATLRYNTQLNNMQIMIGRVVNNLTKGLISSLATYVEQNKEAIITVGTLVGGIAAVASVTFLAAKSFIALGQAMSFVSKHPIIAALSVILGLVTAIAGSRLLGDLEEAGSLIGDMPPAAKDLGTALGGASDEASKLAKQLKKIDEQMDDVRSNFREQLAQLVADKNANIAQLTSQLQEEEAAYRKTYEARFVDFQKTELQETIEHEKKVKILQNQIDFLRKYDSASNRAKLSELEFALARENNLYAEQTSLRQQEYDLETQAQLTEYEKRRLENETKLNEELALLQKHREDVLSIRDVMLLDEIETLKRSRDEQLKSLSEQRADAVESNRSAGASAGQAFSDEFQKWMDDIKNKSLQNGKTSGEKFAFGFETGYKPGITNGFQDMLADVAKNWGGFFNSLKSFDPSKIKIDWSKGGQVSWATGGYTGAGGVNEPAGIVHRGEYVLPKSVVNQGTGMPDWEKMGVGQPGNTTTVEINLSLSGVMASSPSDERAIAMRLAKRINEALTAKGQPVIPGV